MAEYIKFLLYSIGIKKNLYNRLIKFELQTGLQKTFNSSKIVEAQIRIIYYKLWKLLVSVMVEVYSLQYDGNGGKSYNAQCYRPLSAFQKIRPRNIVLYSHNIFTIRKNPYLLGL